jgi:hypothetical protein
MMVPGHVLPAGSGGRGASAAGGGVLPRVVVSLQDPSTIPLCGMVPLPKLRLGRI